MNDKFYDFLEKHPKLEDIHYHGRRFINKVVYFFQPKYKLEKEHKALGLKRIHRPTREFDTFDARTTLAWVTYPILVRFRNNPYKMGHPVELKNEQEWEQILDDIILAFEILIKEDYIELEMNFLEKDEIIQKGLDLYAKFFLNLWD